MDEARGSDLDAPLERNKDEEPADLATRLRAGDGSALLELFRREERRAFALAYRILGNAAAAEDAVQEAFVQLWQRAGQVDPNGGRVESLLMTIVHRRAVDQVRRTHRMAARLPDPELLQQIDERATDMLERVEEKLSSAALHEGLRTALDGLPPEQRTILEQAYFQHRTLRQIAESECLPLGTVKSRLRLAMARLAKTLGGRAEHGL